MYNRYLCNDHGAYTPIPDDTQESSKTSNFSKISNNESCPEPESTPSVRKHALDALKELYHSLADRLHLDTGDLLLLAMLYFLYREDADEELLIALGLLLIL